MVPRGLILVISFATSLPLSLFLTFARFRKLFQATDCPKALWLWRSVSEAIQSESGEKNEKQ